VTSGRSSKMAPEGCAVELACWSSSLVHFESRTALVVAQGQFGNIERGTYANRTANIMYGVT
jgi:hypothetical protein